MDCSQLAGSSYAYSYRTFTVRRESYFHAHQTKAGVSGNYNALQRLHASWESNGSTQNHPQPSANPVPAEGRINKTLTRKHPIAVLSQDTLRFSWTLVHFREAQKGTLSASIA